MVRPPKRGWTPFGPLDRKLLRGLWHMRSQALAIAALMACGVAVLVMSVGMMRSLEATRDAYYERYRFADVFAPLKRAPDYVLAKIQRIDGVRVAEARITGQALLDIPRMAEPVTARLHSLPEHGEPRLNALVLRTGRLPDPQRAGEVVVNESFALAHGFPLGTTLSATLHGTRQKLVIVGTVLSPEYVYAMAPGQILPDNKRFGVIWMGRRHLAAAFDLDGAFNEALVGLNRGARKADVLDALDEILAPYGGANAFGRSDHISDKFLSSELDQISTITTIMPPIFLAVAAFLLNVVLTRLIQTEREEIGLLKAFGYTTLEVGWHYAKLVLILAGVGAIAGLGLGAWLGRGLAAIYTQFYVFPFLFFRAGPDVYAMGLLVSLIPALAGAVQGVGQAIRLPPAEAMRPPAPTAYTGVAIRLLARVRWLDEPSRMILRHLVRRPVRAGLTVTGIAMALGLLISSNAAMDNIDLMMTLVFDYAERQDVQVTLSETRHSRAIEEIRGLPGVLAAEPVRAVAARLVHGTHERRQGIVGLAPSADLSRPIDTNRQPVSLPAEGIMLSTKLAELLDIGPGERLTLKIMDGRRPTVDVQVAGLVDTYLGTPAYMNITALNRLMQEGPLVSSINLLVDAHDTDRLYRELKEMPLVAGVMLQQAARDILDQTMAENMGRMIFFNSLFASMIVVGVVYNNARISLSERARDMASLRVLGFRRAEVSYILLGEMALLTLASLPPGIAIGAGLHGYMTRAFSNDLFTIPYHLDPSTIGWGMLTVLAAALISALVVRHRIDHLDLVEVLKTRE